MDNHRQHYRIGKSETFVIEVKSSDPTITQAFSEELVCDSVDFSASGMRARVDRQLPLNAIYPIVVDLTSPPGQLSLAGQIRWLGECENNQGYYLGVEFLESSDTDVDRWKLYVADQLMEID